MEISEDIQEIDLDIELNQRDLLPNLSNQIITQEISIEPEEFDSIIEEEYFSDEEEPKFLVYSSSDDQGKESDGEEGKNFENQNKSGSRMGFDTSSIDNPGIYSQNASFKAQCRPTGSFRSSPSQIGSLKSHSSSSKPQTSLTESFTSSLIHSESSKCQPGSQNMSLSHLGPSKLYSIVSKSQKNVESETVSKLTSIDSQPIIIRELNTSKVVVVRKNSNNKTSPELNIKTINVIKKLPSDVGIGSNIAVKKDVLDAYRKSKIKTQSDLIDLQYFTTKVQDNFAKTSRNARTSLDQPPKAPENSTKTFDSMNMASSCINKASTPARLLKPNQDIQKVETCKMCLENLKGHNHNSNLILGTSEHGSNSNFIHAPEKNLLDLEIIQEEIDLDNSNTSGDILTSTLKKSKFKSDKNISNSSINPKEVEEILQKAKKDLLVQRENYPLRRIKNYSRSNRKPDSVLQLNKSDTNLGSNNLDNQVESSQTLSHRSRKTQLVERKINGEFIEWVAIKKCKSDKIAKSEDIVEVERARMKPSRQVRSFKDVGNSENSLNVSEDHKKSFDDLVDGLEIKQEEELEINDIPDNSSDDKNSFKLMLKKIDTKLEKSRNISNSDSGPTFFNSGSTSSNQEFQKLIKKSRKSPLIPRQFPSTKDDDQTAGLYQESCIKCKRTFFTSIGHKCFGNKIYDCEFCDKKWAYKYDILKHQKAVHPELLKKFFTCNSCGKKFKMKMNLEMHYAQGKCSRLWSCDICGKGFKVKRNLRYHIVIHSKYLAECEICGAEMKPGNLKQHRDRKHLVENVDCIFCGETLKNWMCLADHVRRKHKND